MTSRRLTTALLFTVILGATPHARAGDGDVVLIHSGDVHGHLVPRPNVRSDGDGRMEGGVARMYTLIQKIRREARHHGVDQSLLINTGDTVQGSGEALFTRGQAMIDVLNLFGFDAHAPGNWDFLYGPQRFTETFIGANGQPPLANWNAIASNLYYTAQYDPGAVCGVTDASGNRLKRVLPPYLVRQVGDVKVGILGFTTARAIAAIGPKVTAGYRFTDGQTEYPCYIDVLRNQEHVDLLVVISELEMARDIKLAEGFPGVDVILNSDMHERTVEPIVTSTGTVIVEEGQDGTTLGELRLKVRDGKVKKWKWAAHIINDRVREDRRIADKVAEVRRPFVTGTFVPGQKVAVGGNSTTLLRPIDEIVAYTHVDLHRSNFVDETLPAVVEGSSHDLITDAMRWGAAADIATIRGFRYGTHVPAGWPITMQDIYHYLPVAAKLGKSPKACGADLKTQVEGSVAGTFNPDPTLWTGGWLFGYSNMTFDLDGCAGFGIDAATQRGTNIRVGGVPISTTDTYNSSSTLCNSGATPYSVAGYWYADDPTTINNCPLCRGRLIQVTTTTGETVNVDPAALPDSDSLLDITEAVVRYLQAPRAEGGLDGIVTADSLPLHRIAIKRLPSINPYPFKVVQPLNGATAATCPPLAP